MAAASSPAPLSKQDVIRLLDSIPVFNVVTEADNRIVGTTDEHGAECVRWFADADEAGSAMVVAQARNPAVSLQLACTPLGTAFALSEGWQSTPSKLPLKLHASRQVVAGVAEELNASADADAFPVFCCDELSSARVRPFFLSKQDLAETWVAAGRSADSVPTELTVVLLSKLVQMMLTGHGGIDWRTAMFIASGTATAKAHELTERAEAAAKAAKAQAAAVKAAEEDPEAEPPALV